MGEIFVDFSEEELEYIDSYAKLIGEDRETLLQRIFKDILVQIKNGTFSLWNE